MRAFCTYILALFFLLLGLESIGTENLQELPQVTGPDLKRSSKHILKRKASSSFKVKKEPRFASKLEYIPKEKTPTSEKGKIRLSPFLEREESLEFLREPKRENKRSSFYEKFDAIESPQNTKEANHPVEKEAPSQGSWEDTKSYRPKKSNTLSSLSLRNSRLNMPDYYQGLYINARTAKLPTLYKALLQKAYSRGMNALVVDVQPNFPQKKFFENAKARGFYLVSRIVVFEGGLKRYPPSSVHLEKIYNLAQKSAELSFDEIQLDYIRFADRKRFPGLSMEKRYRCIENILKTLRERLKPYRIALGADLFGRVAFNQNDRIAQKIELFAAYVDTIYPMLYPSHFYGMPRRIKNPYSTVKDGIQNSIKRAKKIKEEVRIVAYIQAFRISIAPSGLSFVDYIYEQIKATEQAGGSGYIAWNAGNQYSSFFKALRKFNTIGISNKKNTFERASSLKKAKLQKRLD